MNQPYLEITYRHGRPFAAYLYLPRRPGDTAVRTERHGPWLLDLAGDGRAIGVEFTRMTAVDLTELNRVLAARDQPTITREDLQPLNAA